MHRDEPVSSVGPEPKALDTGLRRYDKIQRVEGKYTNERMAISPGTAWVRRTDVPAYPCWARLRRMGPRLRGDDEYKGLDLAHQ